jgi:hypothetical protein
VKRYDCCSTDFPSIKAWRIVNRGGDYSCKKLNGNTISKFNGKYNFKFFYWNWHCIDIEYWFITFTKIISYGIKQILVGHFISAIVFVVFSLFAGDNYTIDHVLNGKKDDPILISERYVEQLPLL